MFFHRHVALQHG